MHNSGKIRDLDNKSNEEGDDDDEDKADEDHEDPAGTSGHQGNDDDNDDADQPGTGPFGGASTDPPPPSTFHADPLASTGINDHPHGTGAVGGQDGQKHCNGFSSKGKEKATIGSTDSFTDANPWLYKEFHLAKQVQLKEYLQADDMYSDMQRLAALYTGVMQVANSWKLAQYQDRTKCVLPKHPAVIQVLDGVPDILIDSTIKDVNPWAKQLTTDKIKSVGLQVEMLLGHKPQYECMQQENDILVNYFELMPDLLALLYAMRVEEVELPRFYPALYPPHTEPADQLTYIQIVEQIGDWWEKAEGLWKEWITVINEVEQKKIVKKFRTAVGEFKAGMRSWKRHMQVLVKHTNALLQLNIAASKIPEKQIENMASNEDTYREIGEILFEAKIKANQPEPAGWLATASHCHKLARARVTKGKKTLYYPQTTANDPL
ncbi:hypothetical protein L7F22_036874 [Adiantum nelumboides]|nr:hypothetical protein [Adiantum nelumboides]